MNGGTPIEPQMNVAPMPDMFDDSFLTELSDFNGPLPNDNVNNLAMMDAQPMMMMENGAGHGFAQPGFHNSLNEIDFTNVDL
ncbi:hypothetical protein WICPIJ_003708, partial [Wickerhamomyces pijperi]